MSKPAAQKWVPRARDYGVEKTQWSVQHKATKYHPLLSTEVLKKVDDQKHEQKQEVKQEEKKVPEVVKPKPKRDFVDPLSMFGGGGDAAEDNPLTSPKSEPVVTIHSPPPSTETKEGQKQSKLKPEFEPWSDKMPRVLAKYTTNKRIAVTANFLEDDEKEGTPAKAVDQAKNRLEQLEIDEQSEAAKSMMTQNEYIAYMEDQHMKLKQAWDSGERVVALKISIQCAKLLGDTTVPAFYPSMYVLLTTVLDTFGDLVFQRIKSRGIDIVGQAPRALPNNFKSSDVSSSAKETCRNWFFKTACIRELMPRLYIDMALIKSYRFLDEFEYVQIFNRLSRAIRGIGDPLAATYARAFLTTKLNDVSQSFQPDPSIYYPPAENLKKSLLEAFDDFMFTFKAIKADDFKGINHVAQNKVAPDEYVDLYSPALEWILQNIGFNSPEHLFFALLKEAQEKCGNSAVLVHFLTCFRPSFISDNAMEMCKYIKEATENAFVKKYKLYLALGQALIKSPPPQKLRMNILSEVWKVVPKIEDPVEYMDIAVVFIQYILVNASDREVNIFLKDVIKHVKKDQAHIKLQEQLQTIVIKVMEHNQDLEKTLSMDNFLPIIDLLEKGSKVPAGKMILQAFARSKMMTTSDPVIIHTLFDVARSLHDSIDSMTFEDERRQIGDLIVAFVRKVDYGRELEKQLNIYVECRQAFTNLDKVTSELVLRVAKLANRANMFMKGKHTRKTAAFVKACLAYCHITIPSLDDFFTRLHLLLQCGEIAYVSQMSVQGEAFLKAAISLIPDIPSKQENSITKKVHSTEPELVGFIRNFSSFLLYCPGNPTSGPFYLVKGLLNAVNTYEPWKAPGSVGKTKVYLGLLSLFATYGQTTFPSHIERVESNDSLYGCDDSYKAQLYELITGIVEAIMTQLAEIGGKGDLISKKEQGMLALEFVNILVVSMEMNPTSATMVVRLVQLAQNTKAVDVKYLQATLANIRNKKGSWYEDIANKIAALQETS